MENHSTRKINIFKKEFFSKYKKRLIIIGGGILLLGVVVGVISYFNGKEKDFVTDEVPGIKQNRNQEFLKEQKIEGFIFKDIKCTFDGKNSLLSYNIVNNTNESIHLNEYEIYVKDKNGNVLTVIAPNLDQEIKPDEKFPIVNEVNIDITDAYELELKIINNVGQNEESIS